VAGFGRLSFDRRGDDVSFEVYDGEIFGLIGPNGGGKTTTMECVRGASHAGPRHDLGARPRSVRDVYELQDRIGVQLQQAQLQKRIKVWEAVHLWAALYEKPTRRRRAARAARARGQAQRLVHDPVGRPEAAAVHRACAHQRSGSRLSRRAHDGTRSAGARAIWELVRGIRARGKTVFLTTHLMEEAERLCDRVAIIDHGRISRHGHPDG
jgi:ABC-2 type transport system ATP-binding protein